jgi:hypothetical protein
VERNARRVYLAQYGRFDDDRARIREDVLAELRVTRGYDFPTSMGGRLMVQILSEQRFLALLDIEHGIQKPIIISCRLTRYREAPKSWFDSSHC